MENQAKTCKQCGRLLTLDHYRKVRLSDDGHAHICKECAAIARKARKEDTANSQDGHPVYSNRGGDPRLADFKPFELIAELRARGYSGTLKVTREINV